MESITCKSADDVFISANEVVSTFERDRVLIDIAYNVGAKRLTDKYEIDSRLLVKEMIVWADNFIEIHRNSDWETKDYILAVDEFAELKVKKNTNKLQLLT